MLFLLVCASLLCAGPGEAQNFFEEVAPIPNHYAGSIAVGDYDNDGRPDIFPSEHDREMVLWHNEGNGKFFDRASETQAFIPPISKAGGSALVDYDNDGDLDIFVTTGWGYAYIPEILLRNDRGIFTDVSFQAGLTDRLPNNNAIWLDYDRDGNLDIYVGHTDLSGENPDLRNALYRNNGDGTFANRTAEAGLDLQLSPDGGSAGGMSGGGFQRRRLVRSLSGNIQGWSQSAVSQRRPGRIPGCHYG